MLLAMGLVWLMLVVPSAAIDRPRERAAESAEAQPGALQPDDGRDRDREPDRDRDGERGERRLDPQFRPPGVPYPDPQSRWSLGVEGDNGDSGVRIRRVIRGSAAWENGLEPRDVIVTVDGYQVGRVGRRVYELGRELNLRADRGGRVRLLVWNHRNGELVTLPVSLDRDRGPLFPRPEEGGIEGDITFRATIQTNREAEVVVQLLDVTERQRRPVIAQQRIPFTGQLPVHFHLDVNLDELDRDRRYAVEAALEVGGRSVLESTGLYELGQVNPNDIDMLLEPVRFDRR
jgi:uncharacterized lipoprotein YbaY